MFGNESGKADNLISMELDSSRVEALVKQLVRVPAQLPVALIFFLC
jgi:aryl carrier-like protein